MLSKRERERLAAIESSLAEDDPQLAELFNDFRDGHGRKWTARGFVLVTMIVFFGALALVCVFAGQVPAALTLMAMAGTCGVFLWSGRRSRRDSGTQ